MSDSSPGRNEPPDKLLGNNRTIAEGRSSTIVDLTLNMPDSMEGAGDIHMDRSTETVDNALIQQKPLVFQPKQYSFV